MISIIIPCLNLENFITPMLESLKCQSYKDFEVIFALDDCVDNTKQIIESYSNDFKLTVCEGKWHRAALGRNAGFALAKGDWVWFMDGDDWLTGPDSLQIAADIIEAHPEAEAIKFLNTMSSDCKANTYDHCVWNWIAKKQALIDNGIKFENMQFYEDTLFSGLMRISLKVHYYNNPKAVYYYNYPRVGSTRDKLELKSPVYCVLPCIDCSQFMKIAKNWQYIRTDEYITDQAALKELIQQTIANKKRLLLTAYPWVADLLFALALPVNLILTADVPEDERANLAQLQQMTQDIVYYIPDCKAETLCERMKYQLFPGSVGGGQELRDNL